MTVAELASSVGYRAGWLVVRQMPEPLARWIFVQIADYLWWRNGKSVRQLEANLRRVQPSESDAALRELSRAAMRSYLRYWVEAFRLPTMSKERIAAEMSTVGEEQTALAHVKSGRGVVFALPHSGNVDLAAAWVMTRGFGQISVIAERLKPESVFRQFVAYRESLGMEVVPHTGGPSPFGVMARRLREGRLVCLVADRDLSAGGVEVEFFGQPARIGAGPAALAARTGAALMPVVLWFEGDEWRGHIYPEIPVPPEGTQAQKVATMSQQLASVWESCIAEHPQDWHMLQKVFVADLDASRLPSPEPTAVTDP
ncbi:MAG: phosphatidylinositol mannoside acyltransferase, partial [Actinobacteria bacterium]|nr:phosphatidylinositol mannoside acyltransferase [Actinomycetota bacterium]